MRYPRAATHPEAMTVRFVVRNLEWSDLGVALWVAFCIVLGIAIGNEVRQLDRYGLTIDQSANALDRTASALDEIAGLPFIGGDINDLAAEIAVTAQRMRTSAADTRSAAHDLSRLLTAAVTIIPTAPVLAVYLPHRVRQIKTNRELVRSVHRNRDAGFTQRYLAHRALLDLPYDELQQIGQDPWAQVREGRIDRLAAEELRRLGLDDDMAATAVEERDH